MGSLALARVAQCERLSTAGLVASLQWLTDLRSLDLGYCLGADSDALGVLNRLTQLTDLDLAKWGVSDLGKSAQAKLS